MRAAPLFAIAIWVALPAPRPAHGQSSGSELAAAEAALDEGRPDDARELLSAWFRDHEDDAATYAISDPFPVDEYVLVLSGKLILTDARGTAHEYLPGDSLVVPKGFTGIWKMLGNYRELIAAERQSWEASASSSGA